MRVGSLNGSLQNDDIAEGIAYAASRGADIINMSFGDSSSHLRPILKVNILSYKPMMKA